MTAPQEAARNDEEEHHPEHCNSERMRVGAVGLKGFREQVREGHGEEKAARSGEHHVSEAREGARHQPEGTQNGGSAGEKVGKEHFKAKKKAHGVRQKNRKITMEAFYALWKKRKGESLFISSRQFFKGLLLKRADLFPAFSSLYLLAEAYDSDSADQISDLVMGNLLLNKKNHF